MFDADAFSIYAVVDAIVTEYLSADGTTYEVTVTYGPEALIPEGSSLEVTEFAEGDAAYADAYNAVLADMLSRGVAVNLDTLGFAALDISIHNAEGEEIEPAAAVQVDMKIKALPGVEDPSLVADSLSVQHHVETENGVVVEQVFAGNSDAAFTMDTNENVIASGYEVDRSIVTEEALAALRGNDAEALDEYVDYDALEASFTTEYFSTFTVTWGSASGASDLQNGAQYIIYASDASDGKIYALKPNGANDPVAVEVTIQDGLVSYSGDKNDLYWNVSTTGNGDNKRYTFSYTSGSRTYYLGAGVNNNHVIIKQTQGNYGNGQSTSWGQWSNYLHSAGDTFLQCHEGTFRVRNISGISNWMGTSNIYFEKQNPTFQEITVHYVDENYNELPSDIITGNASSALRYAYLIYDVEGYDYVRTEYKSPSASSGTSAYPLIRVSDGKILTDPGDGNSSPVYTTIPNNRDVYVVYKPRASSTTGGIPVPILDTTVSQPPEAPSVTKTSVVNGDGTNTISLTVVGHNSDIESYKLADVLIIFDRSGSMAWDMDGNDTTGDSRRIAIAKKAVNNLAHLLFQKNKPGTAFDSVIRMGLISFSNTETDEIVGFTNSESDFNTAVNGMTAGGGTNWESALSVADQMAFESERASFVIFVTDGDPTFRYSRMTETDVSIEREGVSAGSSGSYYPLYDVYGAGNSDSAGNNYQAALAYAQSIVGSDKRFYAIGISNDVTNLQDFTDDAFGLPDGEHSDHCVVAANEADLQSAFNDIGREILGLWGHSDIDVVDGITDLTQTVEKAGMVSLLPEEDNFTYYRGTVTVETKTATQADVDAGKAEHVGDEFTVEYVKDEDWSTWNPASEGCQPATYNDATGAVEWNMGNNFIPLEGYAYRVDFKVWPSQEAYDIIAQLNNGVLFMDDTNKVIKDAAGNVKYDTTIYEQIGGNLTDGYYLKTNTSAKYSYSQATVTGNKVNVVPNTESGDKTIVYDVPDLSLVTQPLKIQKEWESASSSQLENKPDQIDLELYSMDKASGSTVYRTVSLNDTNSWTNDENYVSYGLVSQTGSGLVIYEKGHDFTLRESAYYKKDSGGAMRLANNLAHYWDLSPGVYRPMVVAYESGGAKTTKKTVLERVYGDGIPSALSATTPFWHDGGAQNTSNPLYAANMKETYNTYTGDYYWLPDADGTTYHAYIDTGSDVIMLAYNKARSYVDLMKDILGPDGNPVSAPDEEFTITGTINVPTDIPYYFENGERYVFISVRGPDGSTILLNDHPNNVWKPSELYAAGHADMSEPYPGYYVEVGDYLYSVIDTTQPFTLKIKQGYSIRFLNIAEGTTFHLSEIGLDSNEYDTPSITLLARQRVYDPGTNTTSAWTVLENKTYADTTDVDYTVEELNTTYRFTYINKLKTAQKVTILKTNEDGSTALTGAKFDLYSEAGWLADPKSALKTDLETGADGKIELGYLPKGTYYLKETQAPEHYNLRETPVKIEVRDANVVYDDGTVLSTSGNGRMGNTTDGFTLKVTNSRFGSLPNTGGHGTKAFTWAGAALVLIAALGYLRRMRRKGGQSG